MPGSVRRVPDPEPPKSGDGGRMRGPSRTALGAAMHRAAHQLLDDPPLFEDASALAIVGRDAERELRQGRARHAADAAAILRAFIVVRSRLAEDCVHAAFVRGTKQCVLLGAGLDTLAYRLGTALSAMVFFEVDHPKTQAWKQQRVSDAGIAVPPNVRYAPVDFESEELPAGLQRIGFRETEPAVFVWLGVAAYLTRDAIGRTLRLVAGNPGNEIVFDYAEPIENTNIYLNELARRVREVGEPLLTFFSPDGLAGELEAAGFSNWQDWNAAKLGARYLDGRSDGLRLGSRGHIMHARV